MLWVVSFDPTCPSVWLSLNFVFMKSIKWMHQCLPQLFLLPTVILKILLYFKIFFLVLMLQQCFVGWITKYMLSQTLENWHSLEDKLLHIDFLFLPPLGKYFRGETSLIFNWSYSISSDKCSIVQTIIQWYHLKLPCFKFKKKKKLNLFCPLTKDFNISEIVNWNKHMHLVSKVDSKTTCLGIWGSFLRL